MQKSILVMVLIATVIIAGCAGTKDAGTTEQPAAQPQTTPTGDASAISSGAADVGSAMQDLDSADSELQPDINASDLDLGI